MEAEPLMSPSRILLDSQVVGEYEVSLDDFQGPFDPVPDCSLPDSKEPPTQVASVHVMIVDAEGCVQSATPTTVEGERAVCDVISAAHAYAKVGNIKPGTYSRCLLRSTPRPKGRKLQSRGCWTAISTHGLLEDSIKDYDAREPSRKHIRRV